MRAWRIAYSVVGWIFFAAVLGQVFLAGLGTLVDPAYWDDHRTFVHFFELLPIVLLAMSFPAHLRGEVRWLPLVAVLLIGTQYATAGASPALVAGLHPVVAVIIAGLGFRMAQKAWTERSTTALTPA